MCVCVCGGGQGIVEGEQAGAHTAKHSFKYLKERRLEVRLLFKVIKGKAQPLSLVWGPRHWNTQDEKKIAFRGLKGPGTSTA